MAKYWKGATGGKILRLPDGKYMTNASDCCCGCVASFAYESAGAFSTTFSFFGSGSPTPVLAWHWDFGDGATSSQQNPTHTYSTSQRFPVVVTLKITISGGVTCSASRAIYWFPPVPCPCWSNVNSQTVWALEVKGITNELCTICPNANGIYLSAGCYPIMQADVNMCNTTPPGYRGNLLQMRMFSSENSGSLQFRIVTPDPNDAGLPIYARGATAIYSLKQSIIDYINSHRTLGPCPSTLLYPETLEYVRTSITEVAGTPPLACKLSTMPDTLLITKA